MGLTNSTSIMDSSTAVPTQSVTDGNVSGTMNGTDHEEVVHLRSSPPMQATYQQVEPAAVVAPPQKIVAPVESAPEKVEHPVEPTKEPEPTVVPNIPAKQTIEPVAPVIPTVSNDEINHFEMNQVKWFIEYVHRALRNSRRSPTCLRPHLLTMEQHQDCPTPCLLLAQPRQFLLLLPPQLLLLLLPYLLLLHLLLLSPLLPPLLK